VNKKKKPPSRLFTRILLRILIALAALVVMGVFYLSVILSMPDENAPAAAQATPRLLELPPGTPAFIETEPSISDLAAVFPAPIIRLKPTQELTLTAGCVYDMAFEGAFAREAELIYMMDDKEISLRSIYPRHAYALLEKEGFSLSPLTGYSLMSLPAVRMDSDGWIRFHAQGADALYVLTLPRSAASDADALTRITIPEVPIS